MARLSRNELRTLVEHPRENCVSIYLPTHQAGPDIEQDPIRFKHTLEVAKERLVNNGVDSEDARGMVNPAYELDDDHFWRHQNNGLAIFIAPNFFRYYRLPLNFEELVVVSDRFHVKPLLPLLGGNERFYILGLSQDQVRLLEATRDRVNELNVNNIEEVPESLSEALKFEVPEERVENPSTGSAKQAGRGGLMLHGHGPGARDQKDEIKRFFDKLDAGIQDLLREDDPSPLILFGVEYLIPIYKEASGYPNLMEDAITGNPEGLKPEELHEQAWKIAQPYFQQSQQEAFERFKEMIGNKPDFCSYDLQEIVKASYYQLIDSLFLAMGHQQWGYYDPRNNTVQLHESQQAGDEDMLDFAAVYTLLNSGKVFPLDPDQMLVNAPAAAILRFEDPGLNT
ncbi:MAG: hypothetical protein BRC49_17465 [Cyanobacteria bacterium SW_10_48_33]|jgi:hypothetical protein|nr:MAG: hypothetical protein BRC49_17465 [Cyanobacteria bacterium SW_10_48_33]